MTDAVATTSTVVVVDANGLEEANGLSTKI